MDLKTQEVDLEKIVERSRIFKVMDRAVQGREALMLKCPEVPNLTVRSYIKKIEGDAIGKVLRLEGVSEKGLNILEKSKSLRVEFAGLVSHVTFVSRVKKIHRVKAVTTDRDKSMVDTFRDAMDSSGFGASLPSQAEQADTSYVIIDYPTELSSMERRTQPRYSFKEGIRGFIQLQKIGVASDSPVGPIRDWGHPQLERLLALTDMSEGGICVSTRFPFALDYFDNNPKEIYSINTSLANFKDVPLLLCWKKKLVFPSQVHSGKDAYYRFGFSFEGLAVEQVIEMRKLLYELATSGSI